MPYLFAMHCRNTIESRDRRRLVAAHMGNDAQKLN